MRSSKTTNRAVITFDSFDGFIDSAVSVTDTRIVDLMKTRTGFFGGVSSMRELERVAREGLSSEGIEATRISQDAVTVMDREMELPSFSSFYDVSGADVDVARYLSGEPECMINHHMVDTPRVGRVITLVVSICAPDSVSAEKITERGLEIVSLVFAIEKIGFQVELWADMFVYASRGNKEGRIRILVKGPGEQLDSGRIMFAFTHPGMLRGLCLHAMNLLPTDFKKALGVGDSYGCARRDPDLSEYPEGSILIPTLMSNRTANTLVTDTLKELGII